jgi:hypothetical protein
VTTAGSSALLDPAHADLIQRRVSIHVATRDAGHRPHLMRAMGVRWSDDGRRMTLFVHAPRSHALLDDIRANGMVAVVFSEPSSNRTLQFKGHDAVVVAVEPGDPAIVARYVERFGQEIGELGIPAEVVKSVFAHREADLAAVRFTPDAVFEQTPGPRAGEPLVPGAAS